MIRLPAYLTGFSSRADRSAGIRFTTQELAPEDFVKLQELNGAFGQIVFRENELQDEDIPQEDVEESKTPSQRLRGVLYRLWEQEGKKGTFNEFYRARMEKLIDWHKAKLDPMP